MSTNFKWVKIPKETEGKNIVWKSNQLFDEDGKSVSVQHDNDDPVVHIGKRAAAGKFCWDCNITLCIGGNDEVHKGCRKHVGCDCGWYKACPKCKKEFDKEQKDGNNPGMVELGFAKPRNERPTGIKGASSFSFAQDPERVYNICKMFPDEKIIEDEYGRQLTGQEFLNMLDNNCPIRFTDSVGVCFS